MLNKLFSSRKTLKVDLCFPGDNNKLSIVKNKILWETFFPLHKETGQELNFMMTKFRIHVALIDQKKTEDNKILGFGLQSRLLRSQGRDFSLRKKT